jgi:hypothetical protein
MITVSATSLSMNISSLFRASTIRALSAAPEIVVGMGDGVVMGGVTVVLAGRGFFVTAGD